MPVDYYKYHALGNDYVVIDSNKCSIPMTKKNIELICHRNFGVGSDGILYGPISEKGHMRLRIFNPDGSEAEKSGNGIRIFSRFLFEHKYVNSKEFSLQTLGGTVQIKILDDEAKMIRVEMGKVTFKSSEIPVNGPSREVINEEMDFNGSKLHATCLSIGNPHCVIPVKEATKDLALKLGPSVENDKRFPNRINMQLLQVLDKSRIKIEIWERGAGYTLASGSSSCAAASAAYKLGLAGPDILVHMPGGNIRIEIQPDQQVWMTGSVTAVGQGEFAPEFRQLMEKS